MKITQIAVGSSYEDKSGKTVRTVFSRYESNGVHMVEYTERPSGEAERPLYWRLRETHSLALAKFARWAARPADTKRALTPVEITTRFLLGVHIARPAPVTAAMKRNLYRTGRP